MRAHLKRISDGVANRSSGADCRRFKVPLRSDAGMRSCRTNAKRIHGVRQEDRVSSTKGDRNQRAGRAVRGKIAARGR
jgi:hypothetical protein